MSLGKQAVKGAAWTVVLGIFARAVGLIGTLVITRFLSPAVVGEVQVAVVLAITANTVSNLGLGNYVAARPNESRDGVFHVTVLNAAFLAVACAAAYLLRDPLTVAFGSGVAARYVPWMLFSIALDRLSIVPARLLVREMQFRRHGLVLTAGEIVYPAVAIPLAMAGFGGFAIVFANVGRAAVRAVGMLSSVRPSEWLTPCRLTMAKTREVLGFGVPNGVAVVAAFGAKNWDNLLVAAMFGPTHLGYYQLAYNLADVPAVTVGEQIGDVLLPSFARLPPERRAAGLARAFRLLALVMLPMAIGLAVVAPTLVWAFLDDTWAPVAPRLAILALLSAVTPIGYVAHSYLNATAQPRLVMVLWLARIAMVMAAVYGCAVVGGPIGACAGPVVGLALHAVFSLWLVTRREQGAGITTYMRGFVGPALACVVMAAVVFAVRAGLRALGVDVPLVYVVIEIVAAAVAYVGAALVLSRDSAAEFLSLAREALRRRRRPA